MAAAVEEHTTFVSNAGSELGSFGECGITINVPHEHENVLQIKKKNKKNRPGGER